MRTLTRFGGKNAPQALAKLMLAVLASLKGTVLLYQGEELGLPEADLRRDQLKDPVGDLYYPLHKGRDGCRTPMPWDADKHQSGLLDRHAVAADGAGASRARGLGVRRQRRAPRSQFARAFLAMRKKHPALRWGEIVFRDVPGPLLAFERRLESERVLCVFNMSAEKAAFAPDQSARADRC